MVEISDMIPYVSIIASFATAIALAFLAYTTWSLKKERDSTLRAWVGLAYEKTEPNRYFTSDGKAYTGKKYRDLSDEEKNKIIVSEVEWRLVLKNSGRIPAIVQGRFQVVLNNMPSSNVLDINFGPEFFIMSGEKHGYLFRLSPQVTNQLLDEQTKTFLMHEFRYHSEGSKKNHLHGLTLDFGPVASLIVDLWNEKTKK